MSASAGTGVAGGVATPARPLRRNYARRYAGFIVPAAVVVVAVIVFPWVFTLYMSVHDWKIGGARSYVGLENYITLFSDERFGWAVLRTLWFTLLAVVAPMVLGVLAAVCFHRKFPLRGVARTIFILPMMATPVAVALVWTMMFHPQLGVLNWILTSLGLPPSAWVYDASTVIPTLVLVETWHWTPLVMLIVLGGLASLPTDPYEAAKIDGANGWQRFWRVTLPMLRPTMFFVLVTGVVSAAQVFDTVYALTGGGPAGRTDLIAHRIYDEAFGAAAIGRAAVMALVLFAVLVGVTVIQQLSLGRRVSYDLT